MNQLHELINKLELTDIIKLVFHEPPKGSIYKKIIGRPVEIKGNILMQFELFTEKQAFHKNVSRIELFDIIASYFEYGFKKLLIQTVSNDYNVFSSKNDVKIIKSKSKKADTKQNLQHNKQKQYLIPENLVVEPLIDLGIFTKDGKIIKSKYDKYKQINRFLELVNDVIKASPGEKLNIIDFGCGKSSLTFILYYFLTEIRKLNVSITGLDLKQDVISNCNEIAKKYNYKNLEFIACDIKDYVPNSKVDMIICLHACDTATDYALFNAIKWNSAQILAVPCCQHEVNDLTHTKNYSILTKYGIVKERISALMTDVIRANLLEIHDYDVQILEFVDFTHSPKNLLIRAVKKTASKAQKAKAKSEIDTVLNEYEIFPTLCKLLDYKLGRAPTI